MNINKVLDIDYTGLLIVFNFCLLLSCKQNIDLNKFNKTELTYEQLPSEVKIALINDKNNSVVNIDKKVINIDSISYKVEIIQERDGPFVGPVFFIIGNKKIEIAFNTPDPFVFYKNELFYPSKYNIYSTDFGIENSNYYKIDVGDIVK